MSFTDGKPRVATAEDLKAPWSGDPKNFRCYLCGHRFEVGDVWRWVYAAGHGVMNAIVCQKCDGDDVLKRWIAHVKDGRERFWWMDR